MNDLQGKDIIGSFMNELNDKTKRKSKGRDTRKNYHKITISINEEDKLAVMKYADDNNITASFLIKELLREKHIIKSLT